MGFEGLNLKVAGATPSGVPHSIFELLNHIIYWQEWSAWWIDGKKSRIPKHASASWPDREASTGPEDLKEAVGVSEEDWRKWSVGLSRSIYSQNVATGASSK